MGNNKNIVRAVKKNQSDMLVPNRNSQKSIVFRTRSKRRRRRRRKRWRKRRRTRKEILFKTNLLNIGVSP